MSSNEEIIREKYSGGGEDKRHLKSRATSLEFHYTKKHLTPHITPESRVLELGCATGYYGMYLADRCREYRGIDLSPENIAIFEEKINTAGLQNVIAQLGDATNLAGIPDAAYDAVLCLGPLYHLPPEERRLVFSECARVAAPGGLLAFAYINALGVYAGACVCYADRNIYPNRKTNKYVFELGTDDEYPGVFYFTSPEEMEAGAASAGLTPVGQFGLDFFFAESAVNSMSDEQFDCYLELADRMSESPSCVGLANHALIICRKGKETLTEERESITAAGETDAGVTGETDTDNTTV